MSQELINAMIEMKEDEAVAITNQLLENGTDPLDVLDFGKQAMDVIGDKFEKGEAFIPELIMAGEMMRAISDIVKPRLADGAGREKLGKIVIGTVEGDIHDIAKDIVSFMLDINGFEVTDLGVDTSTEKFLDAVKEKGADIVGLSGFLTLSFDPMKKTVAALRDSNPNVKIMIGGGQIDEQIREYTGADAYGKDAMAAIALANEWIKE